MNLYGGSQWWTLTRPAVEHILEFTVANPRIVKFFENTWTPDESFFQTIIGNSSFRARIAKNLTLNFIYWKGDADPYLAFKEWETGQRRRRYIDNNFFADGAYGQGQLLFARKFSDDSKDFTEFIETNFW